MLHLAEIAKNGALQSVYVLSRKYSENSAVRDLL